MINLVGFARPSTMVQCHGATTAQQQGGWQAFCIVTITSIPAKVLSGSVEIALPKHIWWQMLKAGGSKVMGGKEHRCRSWRRTLALRGGEGVGGCHATPSPRYSGRSRPWPSDALPPIKTSGERLNEHCFSSRRLLHIIIYLPCIASDLLWCQACVMLAEMQPAEPQSEAICWHWGAARLIM